MGTGAITDLELKNLLNTCIYLNSKISIGENTNTQILIDNKNKDIKTQKVVLQDLKDAISTYNQEFLERETELSQNIKKPMFSNLQDWSLFVLFSGYAVFSLAILIYIFRFSKIPVMLGCAFVLFSTLLYTLFVFMIQRFG
jgi:hypothetical protein